jgi:hypothetical protein
MVVLVVVRLPLRTLKRHHRIAPGRPSCFRGGRPRAVEPPRDVSSVDYFEGTLLKVVSR